MVKPGTILDDNSEDTIIVGSVTSPRLGDTPQAASHTRVCPDGLGVCSMVYVTIPRAKPTTFLSHICASRLCEGTGTNQPTVISTQQLEKGAGRSRIHTWCEEESRWG